MTKKSRFPLAALTLLALIPARLPGQTVHSENGIVYRSLHGIELKMDIVVPAEGTGPWPALVFIFGGGFMSGDRQNWLYALSGAARRGYAAVAIDYSLTSRLGPDAKPLFSFPAQVYDVKAAVRWLRANGGMYGIDPDRLAAVGFSSGGNLALMLGLTGDADFAEPGAGPSSRIQAVVNLAGCADLVEHHAIHPSFMEPYLGGPPKAAPERYRAASPLSWVSGDDPPVLTVVGDQDPALPQERALDEAFRAAGVCHSLLLLPGAGHNLGQLWSGGANEEVWSFLEKHLKPGPASAGAK